MFREGGGVVTGEVMRGFGTGRRGEHILPSNVVDVKEKTGRRCVRQNLLSGKKRRICT